MCPDRGAGGQYQFARDRFGSESGDSGTCICLQLVYSFVAGEVNSSRDKSDSCHLHMSHVLAELGLITRLLVCNQITSLSIIHTRYS